MMTELMVARHPRHASVAASLLIPSDHGAVVSLAFEGPIEPAATRLSLGFNTRDELLDPDAPIGIDLPEASATVDGAVHVGEVTQLTIEVHEIRATPLVTQLDVYAHNDGDRARTTLDDITEVIDHYAEAPIEVIGHSDDRGSADYNLDLSQRRAANRRVEVLIVGVEPPETDG